MSPADGGGPSRLGRVARDDLFHSAPVRLPVEIGDGVARLTRRDRWTLDPITGTIS
ncbi:hypothetical protein J2S43_002642 [Catenuloplanes nepalensis]|uniref:Uncharacterized protein n=1 Tax=Catenuloplanes nepalensis TaxID=587533 RepID=A0ABT9MRU0_9ACTN|nr:hypothetical protein [Catenuloplanes nepalensis]MDP9794130.1 hypothetical protein [Catenuloplanes nepalensis]